MTARLALLAVMAAGCNTVFGLDPTTPADAASPDAPPSCHAGEPPVFSRKYHQVLIQPCRSFTPAATGETAAALCDDTERLGVFSMGPETGPLVEVAPINVGNQSFVDVHMFPEGDRVVGKMGNRIMISADSIVVWSNVGGTWNATGRIGTASFMSTIAAGAPSRGPRAHVMFAEASFLDPDPALRELVEQADGSWTPLTTYQASDLGLADISGLTANLTADGLRMVFPYAMLGMPSGVYYAERANLGDQFGKAHRLEGLPLVGDPYMTEDCSRVYFSGLGTSIFYAQQQ